MSAADAFRDAMHAAGLDVAGLDLVADGDLHRFHVPGDSPGTMNGWYVLHLDRTPAGAFGNWKTGDSHTWCAAGRSHVSLHDRATVAREAVERRHARAQQRDERQGQTRDYAGRLWNNAQPSAGQHPYLLRKGTGAHGVRENRGALLVPMRDGAGVLWNVQTIHRNGSKKFLFGGRVAGLYHAIGSPGNGVLCIAEGYATAATIHEASGYACAAAFTAGNLERVALTLRAKFPAARLVIAADDDAATAAKIGRNPGVEAARAAAAAVGGCVAYPPEFTA